MKILATAVLLTPLACAQTFVVDAANGPGTNFTDIATAVAAVPDGAILEVRPGEYGVFQIQNKSLTIVGTAGVLVRSGIEGTAFDVVGLASDQAVTVRQVAWDGVFPGLFSSVVCRNNRGTVLIDECSPTSGGGRVIFTDCDRAFVRDCLLRSNSVTTAPLDCYSSNVVVTGTDIRSQAFCLRQGGGRVQIAASALTTMVPIAFGQAAVFVGTGELLLHGGTTITSQNASPGPAIAGTGNLAIDPDTVLQGFTNPPFDPNLTVVSRTIPGLDAAAGTLGGNASATLAVPAGATGVLFVGFAATPTFVPGLLDPLWLAGPVRMAVGGAPTVTASYAVPNATWVRGLQIAWRGAVLTGGGAIELSNPALYAHL